MSRKLRAARVAPYSVVALCSLSLFCQSLFAYPVTWEFAGTVTFSAGGSYTLSEDLPLGTPIRILVSFDTDENYTIRPSSDGRPGFRYEYFGADSVKIAIFGGACNPCQPNFVPGIQNALVRDDFADPVRNPPPDLPRDGFTFGIDPHPDNDHYGFLLLVRDFADAFDPPIVDIGPGENPLPIEPDPRLVQMATAALEVTDDLTKNPVVQASLESVALPTLGTFYFLSARHCLYPDAESYVGQFRGDDCVAGGGVPNGVVVTGGGAGHSNFNNTVTHTLATPDAGDPPEAIDELGTVFGAITFDGPLGMPVLRGSSYPTDLGRANSNLFGYQQYNFSGIEATPLQLVVDVGYSIQSDSPITYYPPENQVRPGAEIPAGLRPGGAEMSVVLAVVDAGLISSVTIAAQEFGALVCGAEDGLQLPNGDPWPAGSILGAAIYEPPDNQQGAQTVQLDIRACDGAAISTEPVMVGPGDSFYLTASLQTPARGKLAGDGSVGAAANGYLDAASTIKVIPDPEAPPEVLQQLLSGVAPTCGSCGLPPRPEVIFLDSFE